MSCEICNDFSEDLYGCFYCDTIICSECIIEDEYGEIYCSLDCQETHTLEN